jgi:hypothetical protein
MTSLRNQLAALTLLLLSVSATAFAAPISGVVINRTTNKPAAGDDVVLLAISGMQEIQHVKTDSKGRFTLEVPADGFHLVRVTHDKANYFTPVTPNATSINVDVYTAAPAVNGVTLDADVMRIQTEPGGKGLRVVEHFFEKNESTPPETLYSDHAFEVYLPEGAIVEGAAAKAPAGLAVQVAVQPLKDPNHFGISFPIRPGESEFQVTYRLPYNGSFEFKPRPAMATDTLAVMMPKSMTFKAATGTPYSPVTEELGAQTYVARSVQPSQPLGFTVGGQGELPRDAASGAGSGGPSGPEAGGPASPAEGSAQNNSSDPNLNRLPGKGIDNPLDNNAERESWVSKYKWWLIAGIGFLFAAGAGIMLSTPSRSRGPNASGTPGFVPGPGAALQVLRDEMFAVETDRLEGRLSEAQYSELKGAFDIVLRRALARNGQAKPDTIQVVPE